MWGKYFSLGMAGLDFIAAIIYLAERDFAHSLYWFFAGCIAVTVAYL
jgi:uncharacterized membrane protein